MGHFQGGCGRRNHRLDSGELQDAALESAQAECAESNHQGHQRTWLRHGRGGAPGEDRRAADTVRTCSADLGDAEIEF